MKRYIKSDWSYEERLANEANLEVDRELHRDLSGGMNNVSRILENLGYDIEWDKSRSATTSIDAYKSVSKNGKDYKLLIWCYYYPFEPDRKKYLVSYSILDSNGDYIDGTGPDYPNCTKDDLTEDLFVRMDQFVTQDFNEI